MSSLLYIFTALAAVQPAWGVPGMQDKRALAAAPPQTSSNPPPLLSISLSLGLSISSNSRCGKAFGAYPLNMNCLGSKFGTCCSLYSYCGSDEGYCGYGCQPAFGNCGIKSSSLSSTSQSSTISSVSSSSITSSTRTSSATGSSSSSLVVATSSGTASSSTTGSSSSSLTVATSSSVTTSSSATGSSSSSLIVATSSGTASSTATGSSSSSLIATTSSGSASSIETAVSIILDGGFEATGPEVKPWNVVLPLSQSLYNFKALSSLTQPLSGLQVGAVTFDSFQAWFNQPIVPKASTTYNLSVFIKARDPNPECNVLFYVGDADGPSYKQITIVQATQITTNWGRFTSTFVSDVSGAPTTFNVRILCGPYAFVTRTYFFDDISLVPA